MHQQQREAVCKQFEHLASNDQAKAVQMLEEEAKMVDCKPYEKYVLSRANDDDVGNSLQFFRRESDVSNRSKAV